LAASRLHSGFARCTLTGRGKKATYRKSSGAPTGAPSAVRTGLWQFDHRSRRMPALRSDLSREERMRLQRIRNRRRRRGLGILRSSSAGSCSHGLAHHALLSPRPAGARRNKLSSLPRIARRRSGWRGSGSPVPTVPRPIDEYQSKEAGRDAQNPGEH
jgi:hypothetical protein